MRLAKAGASHLHRVAQRRMCRLGLAERRKDFAEQAVAVADQFVAVPKRSARNWRDSRISGKAFSSSPALCRIIARLNRPAAIRLSLPPVRQAATARCWYMVAWARSPRSQATIARLL